jgi:transposase-like protein
MDIHENARTTPRSRMLMIERLEAGWKVNAVAAAFGVDARTVRKWRERHRQDGEAGLVDRSSRPHASPSRLPDAVGSEIEALRRQRLSGPAIARRLHRPVSTVGKVLRRLGLGRLRALHPRAPVVRYERERPGELIHIDSKKLGRIDGIGHRITGDRTGQSSKRGTGWKPFTSPSTMPRGWPTPKSCPTRRRPARQPFSSGRSASSSATASPSSG